MSIPASDDESDGAPVFGNKKTAEKPWDQHPAGTMRLDNGFLLHLNGATKTLALISKLGTVEEPKAGHLGKGKRIASKSRHHSNDDVEV